MNDIRNKILKNLSDSEVEFLKILSKEMNTQDQRCTSYPIWKLCDIELRYGVQGNCIDGYCIVDLEHDRVFKTPREMIDLILEIESDKNGVVFNEIEAVVEYYNESLKVDKYSLESLLDFIVDVLGWEHYSYCGYIENIKTYKEFFTEKEAQRFLEDNRHKYSDDVYLCVDSAYGNSQMMMLIDILRKIE